MRMLKTSSRLVGAAIALGAAAGGALADWPNDKPIKMIVPFPAGGGTHDTGRLIAQHLSMRFKANIFVENRAGANGQVGMKALKDSPSDGYTIATASGGPLIYNHGLYKERLLYETTKDFAGVGMIMKLPAMIVVHPSVPVKTLQELIALAGEKPGVLNFSSPGYGNFGRLATEFFMKGAAVNMVHVPTTGTAPAVQAVVQGAVQFHFNNVQSLLPLVKDGQLRALGVAELKPLACAPESPTIASGLPGFDMAPWTAVIAPEGTPDAIVKRMSDERLRILEDPEVIAALEKQSVVGWPMAAGDLDSFMGAQITKWNEIIDDAGIKLKQ
jgi:tripartite-type tricarboxylate transporter receptor subunit TctC